MIALISYLFIQRNVVIEIDIQDAAFAERTIAPPPVASGGAVAQNVSLLSAAAEKVTETTTVEKQVAEKPARIAPHINNLTFVLSPTYAERHRISAEVVAAKMAVLDHYIQTYLPDALTEMREYAIPVSITLAQGLLESNAGDSKLATQSNNHFGIKCRSKCRSCTCRNYTDDSIYDMFRVFETVGESYREHSILLSGSRYQHLKKFGKNYARWAHGLKKAGYATDRRYAEKLIAIIEALDLDKYDHF